MNHSMLLSPAATTSDSPAKMAWPKTFVGMMRKEPEKTTTLLSEIAPARS
jgi:hypothetical protein